MRASDITELAERHGIADRDGLADAFFWAGFFYDAAGADDFDEDAPDTLDAIEKPATELALLLYEEVNRQRIINALLDEYHEPEHSDDPRGGSWHRSEVIEEVCDKFDQMLRQLDAVRLAAQRAHQKRGRGRPREKQDIRNAYAELASFLKRAKGEGGFTQEWEGKAEGLIPLSPASCFLYDAMRLIDPKRPRLGEELRRLMQADIAAIGGRRKGRRA